MSEVAQQDRFAGRVAIVTGGASGIGAAIGARLTGDGAGVVVLDIDGEAAARTAEALPGSYPVTADITDPEGVQQAVSDVVAHFGRLDILVNNAVICWDTPLEDLPLPEWTRQVEVGLTGAFLMIQSVLPALFEQGGGSIVNISSVNAVGYYGNEAYSAAKAGLLSLTRSVAVRYASRGVRCNAVAPGTIRTPIWNRRLAADPHVLDRLSKWYPLGRVGTPEDVAAAVAFLASDDAAWITGVTLPVDGGLLAGNHLLAADILS